MQRGQALLVLLLAMSVVVAVVLSSVSRSVTDVSVSTVSEESTRAFSAAEAGAERALILESQGVDPEVEEIGFDTNTDYKVDAVYESPSDNEFVYPVPLASGESATFWLTDRDPETGEFNCDSGDCFLGPTLEVCWGNPVDGPDPDPPAAVVSVYYDEAYPQVINNQNFSEVGVVRFAYDEDNVARNNDFSNPNNGCTVYSGTPNERNFEYRANAILAGLGGFCLSSQGCVLMARVRLLYDTGDTNFVAIRSNSMIGTLPPQGIKIESTGESGEAVRKVEVFRTFPELPIPFESSVFSGGSIVK